MNPNPTLTQLDISRSEEWLVLVFGHITPSFASSLRTLEVSVSIVLGRVPDFDASCLAQGPSSSGFGFSPT